MYGLKNDIIQARSEPNYMQRLENSEVMMANTSFLPSITITLTDKKKETIKNLKKANLISGDDGDPVFNLKELTKYISF